MRSTATDAVRESASGHLRQTSGSDVAHQLFHSQFHYSTLIAVCMSYTWHEGSIRKDREPTFFHEEIMPRFSFRLCAALVVFVGTMQTAHAQITSAEIERGLRFPGTRAYDGDPYTQRYSYGLNSPEIYIGGNTANLYYLDYLDRADRAQKFGYRMPVDPYFETPPVVQTPPTVRVGVGIGFGGGFFRRR